MATNTGLGGAQVDNPNAMFTGQPAGSGGVNYFTGAPTAAADTAAANEEGSSIGVPTGLTTPATSGTAPQSTSLTDSLAPTVAGGVSKAATNAALNAGSSATDAAASGAMGSSTAPNIISNFAGDNLGDSAVLSGGTDAATSSSLGSSISGMSNAFASSIGATGIGADLTSESALAGDIGNTGAGFATAGAGFAGSMIGGAISGKSSETTEITGAVLGAIGAFFFGPLGAAAGEAIGQFFGPGKPTPIGSAYLNAGQGGQLSSFVTNSDGFPSSLLQQAAQYTSQAIPSLMNSNNMMWSPKMLQGYTAMGNGQAMGSPLAINFEGQNMNIQAPDGSQVYSGTNVEQGMEDAYNYMVQTGYIVPNNPTNQQAYNTAYTQAAAFYQQAQALASNKNIPINMGQGSNITGDNGWDQTVNANMAAFYNNPGLLQSEQQAFGNNANAPVPSGSAINVNSTPSTSGGNPTYSFTTSNANNAYTSDGNAVPASYNNWTLNNGQWTQGATTPAPGSNPNQDTSNGNFGTAAKGGLIAGPAFEKGKMQHPPAQPLVDMNYATGGPVHEPIPDQKLRNGHYVKDGVLHDHTGKPIAKQNGLMMNHVVEHPRMMCVGGEMAVGGLVRPMQPMAIGGQVRSGYENSGTMGAPPSGMYEGGLAGYDPTKGVGNTGTPTAPPTMGATAGFADGGFPGYSTPGYLSGGLAGPNPNTTGLYSTGGVAIDPRSQPFAGGGLADYNANPVQNLPQIADSLARGGMPLNKVGFVNKDIPYRKGGMVNEPDSIPERAVEFKASGGLMSQPTMPQGGEGFADGGSPGEAQADAEAQASGDSDQEAQQNQQIAEQAVPKESTADNIPARLSKGEYVMDAPTVMYFGVGKFQKMQEQAHKAIADHMQKQVVQQQQQQQQQQAQGPQGQPQQAQPQQGQQQAPQRGMMAPPAQLPPMNQPQPDASQQRIAQTAQPPRAPSPSPSPFSLAG